MPFHISIAHIGCAVPGCTEVSLTQRERQREIEGSGGGEGERERLVTQYRPNNIWISVNGLLTQHHVHCLKCSSVFRFLVFIVNMKPRAARFILAVKIKVRVNLITTDLAVTSRHCGVKGNKLQSAFLE